MPFEDKKEASVKLLERAAKKYSKFMLFAYGDADSEALRNNREIIGKVPGAMLKFSDKSFILYPHDWTFDDSHMDQFVEMYLRRKFNRTRNYSVPSYYGQRIRNQLTVIKLLDISNFNDTLLSNNQVFIYFFSSLKENLP